FVCKRDRVFRCNGGKGVSPQGPGQDFTFSVGRGIANEQLQEEAIHLGFRQGIGPLLIDRVHGRQDHEGSRQGERLSGDGTLAFLHRLEQGALHLGRCAVDLINQDQVRENRSTLHFKAVFLWPVDLAANDVRGQEIRRELQPAKSHSQGGGQGG